MSQQPLLRLQVGWHMSIWGLMSNGILFLDFDSRPGGTVGDDVLSVKQQMQWQHFSRCREHPGCISVQNMVAISWGGNGWLWLPAIEFCY